MLTQPPEGGQPLQFGTVDTLRASSYFPAHLDQETHTRLYRSLAPSPASVRTVTRMASGSHPVQQRVSSAQRRRTRCSALSPHEVSHLAVVNDPQIFGDGHDDDSASSPLTAFVRQLATAQSSSQDGDVEESSDSEVGTRPGITATITPTTTESGSRRRSLRLPEWLPFSELLGRSRSPSPGDSKAQEIRRGGHGEPTLSRFQDAPDEGATDFEAGVLPVLGREIAGPGLPRQVDPADLASARVVLDAKRLSRELVRTGSLAVLRRRGKSQGKPSDSGGSEIVSAPVSPGISLAHGTGLSAQVNNAAAVAQAGRGAGSDLPSSASSSRLPSLSPVSLFKFHFSAHQQQPESCGHVSTHSPSPADVADAATGGEDDVRDDDATRATPPNPPGEGEEARRCRSLDYRELTRHSADFALPPPAQVHPASAALREQALEVFTVPTTAGPPSPAAVGTGSNERSSREEAAVLRRTIRPGGGPAPGSETKSRRCHGGNEWQGLGRPDSWQVYRDDDDDEQASPVQQGTGDPSRVSGGEAQGQRSPGGGAGSGSGPGGGTATARPVRVATAEAVEAGVLVERTEALVLRRVAGPLAVRRRPSVAPGGGTRMLGTLAAAAVAKEEEEGGEGEGKENLAAACAYSLGSASSQ